MEQSNFVCPECGCTEAVNVRGVGVICKKCRYSPKLMCQVHYDNSIVTVAGAPYGLSDDEVTESDSSTD